MFYVFYAKKEGIYVIESKFISEQRLSIEIIKVCCWVIIQQNNSAKNFRKK